MKCCICGNEFDGFGHNPEGALWRDADGSLISFAFKDEDRCCDRCNTDYVIPGRRYRLKHGGGSHGNPGEKSKKEDR